MNNILNNNHAFEDIEGVILALKHGGGGGGGNVFIVKYNETTLEEIVEAHEAGKTLILHDTEIEGDWVGEIWAQLFYVDYFEGRADGFVFVSMDAAPNIKLYSIFEEFGGEWYKEYINKQALVYYNQTTYEEVINRANANENVILVEDDYDDQRWSWYHWKYALMSSKYVDYETGTGYIEFTRTEYTNGHVIVTRYRLNSDDTYTKSATAVSGDMFEPAHGHPYALDGANLKEVFGSANAMYAALAQEDYSKIHNLDYWPIKFEGTYHDFGEWVALAGTNYYSDTACKQLEGTVESDTVVTYEDASPAYYSITIGGAKYYVKMQDCQRWREKTIDMTAKMEANINAYWRYGDSGTLAGNAPHIMWLARDGIASLKFRSTNQQWADAVEQIETSDGSTTEYTPDDATLKCVRYCTVDGVLKAYNTDYTVDTDTGKLTFKSGKVPTSGQEIIISRTTHDYPWKGSALYQTFNDPDHGLLRLIDDTEFANHIYGGAGGLGMRYAGETRTVANSTSVSWTDRGKMFLPTESEVWGLGIYGQKDSWYHLPQLAVFANGGRRRLSKAASDGGSRTFWWVASSSSVAYIAFVSYSGLASSSFARFAYAAVPGFIGL